MKDLLVHLTSRMAPLLKVRELPKRDSVALVNVEDIVNKESTRWDWG